MLLLSYAETPLPYYSPSYELTAEELNEAQPKMRDRHPSNWKKEFKSIKVRWDDIHSLVNSDYRIYSAGTFKDGIATDDNWQGQESFILDIDDGLTLDEAKKLFKEYQCLITTTKNHQVEKNGIVCDRFRIIMPLVKPINCTQSEYSETMKLIHDIEYPFADKKCKDPSRIYFGFSAAIYFYTDGKPFDFDKYLQRMKRKKELHKSIAPQINTKDYTRPSSALESTQKGFYERVWCTDEMLSALKFEDKFVSGNRNNALLSWTRFFKELGFNDSEVRQVILYINNRGDSIDENEIEKTVFRSEKLSA